MCFSESTRTRNDGTFTTLKGRGSGLRVRWRGGDNPEGGGHLLPDANVPLLDENAGVVDRLREVRLKDLRLQPALEKL